MRPTEHRRDRQPARAAGRGRPLRDRHGDVCGHGAGPARAPGRRVGRRRDACWLARLRERVPRPDPVRLGCGAGRRPSPILARDGRGRWPHDVRRTARVRTGARARAVPRRWLRPRAGFRRARRWKVPAAGTQSPRCGGTGQVRIERERDPRLERRSAKAAHLPDRPPRTARPDRSAPTGASWRCSPRRRPPSRLESPRGRGRCCWST